MRDRQLEILKMLGCGKTSRVIAEELKVSAKTIDTHLSNIKEKLLVKTGHELV